MSNNGIYSLVFMGALLFQPIEPYAQMAPSMSESTPQTVCTGNYCQEAAGALLKKLLQNGWTLKEKAKSFVKKRTGDCGSSFWQTAAVPDYACFSLTGDQLPYAPCAVGGIVGYQAVYLGPACQMHDDCYGSRGASKAACDRQLRDLIIATCDATLYSPFAKRTCRQRAGTFYNAVHYLGCSAYTAAQTGAGNHTPVCN